MVEFFLVIAMYTGVVVIPEKYSTRAECEQAARSEGVTARCIPAPAPKTCYIPYSPGTNMLLLTTCSTPGAIQK